MSTVDVINIAADRQKFIYTFIHHEGRTRVKQNATGTMREKKVRVHRPTNTNKQTDRQETDTTMTLTGELI